MSRCYQHPSAAPVPLPGDPGVKVCSKCPTVVSGEPTSWNRAGTRLQRNQPKHAGNAPATGCLPLIGLVALAILAALTGGA
ncbi:hypothetical protein [Tenggerimyces flavus]|uniref:Uncharacterized protein n=1 Tax=Tenggerimyces flavus TaxID=1708749 RepID=A0ABV7YBB1_9ACTN|nr:hypothetical protein [Tenggerimyces flavus]MBM7788894.1 hypothetical protein [Tenggerimyces flavus]